MITTAKWIWYPEKDTYPNSFVKFRKKIKINKRLKKALLSISADSRYKLYINGKFINRGPAPYDPRYMYYDELDVTNILSEGDNIIAILGYYIGISTRDYVRPHDFSTTAGVLLELDLKYKDNTTEVIISDKNWKTKKANAWKSGTNSCGFSVLPMNEIFDARKYETEWKLLKYNSKNWKNALELDIPVGKPTICAIKDAVNNKDMVVKRQYDEMMATTTLSKRDIDLLLEKKVHPVKIAVDGFVEWIIPAEQFFDTKEDGSFKLHEQKVINIEYNREKPLKVPANEENQSKYYIFDFSKEIYGRVFFEIESHRGTIIEILVSEILKDNFISPEDNFNLWSRYVCTEGKQSFEFFEPFGFRYVLLMIRNNSGSMKILNIGVNSQNYSFEDKGAFECSDDDITNLWEIGKLTQKCCSQDIIFDNPLRERTQYSGDPEFNMLGIYYQFGEYNLARKSLIQLAQSQGPEGNFLTTWPSGDRISRLKEAYLGYVYWKPEIIEGTFYWLLSLWNYYLFSGDIGTLETLYTKIVKLKKRYDEMIGKNEILFKDETWLSHFFGDHIGFKSIEEKILGGNLFYKGFIDTFYKISKALGHKDNTRNLLEQSERIKSALVDSYWSEERKGFFIKNGKIPNNFNILINVYALFFNNVPAGNEKDVAENIKKNITPSYPTPLVYGMVYLALLPFNDDGFIHDELKNKWAKMPSIKETGTFSEFWFSELDWAVRCQNVACPNFILPGLILGVKPIRAGFKEFVVQPDPGFLKWAEGIVPTPMGNIFIRWEKEDRKMFLEVKAPTGFAMAKEEILPGTIRRVYKFKS